MISEKSKRRFLSLVFILKMIDNIKKKHHLKKEQNNKCCKQTQTIKEQNGKRNKRNKQKQTNKETM